jgi:drug/metabolite transporter superfamily protein YnfA
MLLLYGSIPTLQMAHFGWLYAAYYTVAPLCDGLETTLVLTDLISVGMTVIIPALRTTA